MVRLAPNQVPSAGSVNPKPPITRCGGGKIYQVPPKHAYRYGRGETPTVDARPGTGAHTGLQQRDAEGEAADVRNPGWKQAAQVPGSRLSEAGQVADYPIQAEQVGRRRKQVSDQALAVAPEPVELGPGSAPAVTLPALQRDAGDPSCALRDGGAHAAGEILAGGDRARGPDADRNEDLAVAERVQQVAGFVVLGKARGVEGTAAARGGHAFQGRPVEARAHAIGRQEAAQALADGNVLVLVFGEFVAVQPMGPFAEGGRQRQNRHLHHGVAPREPVDQTKRLGVDQIFGVVHRYDFEAHLVPRLVVFHALVDPVEAVALGGGSVMRAGGDVDARVAARLLGDGADGQGVVGVDTHEEVVIPVLDGHQIVLQHAADDGVLVPQRDKDRDGTLRGPEIG